MENHPDEAAALLILARYADNAAALRQLSEKYQSARAMLAASKSEWRVAGMSEKACQHLLLPDKARLEQDREWCSQAHHHVIAWHSPD